MTESHNERRIRLLREALIRVYMSDGSTSAGDLRTVALDAISRDTTLTMTYQAKRKAKKARGNENAAN